MGRNITQVGEAVDQTMESLQAKITKEVMEELEKAGATVVKSYYDGFSEITKIINKFDKYMDNYNQEVDRIRQRYSKEVAIQKIHELDMDLTGEKASVGLDLGLIVDKEKKYKKEAISNNLKSPHYKESRKEAIDILIPFGAKLDEEATLEFIKPLIEAKDLTILKALKESSNNKTRYLYTSAISKIEDYLSTTHLEMAVRDARSYISNPKQGKSLVLATVLHRNSNKKK